MNVVVAHHLSKQFSGREALSSLSLALEAGTLTTLTGPNGSGKTTLVKLLAKLLQPTSGSLAFASSQTSLGLLLEHRHLYRRLTIRENLELFATIQNLHHQRVQAMLEAFDLLQVQRERVEHLSRGQQQRAALARTFLAQPALLLLDEPFVGLDMHSETLLIGALQKACSHGAATLVVGHNLHRLNGISSKVLGLEKGKLLT